MDIIAKFNKISEETLEKVEKISKKITNTSKILSDLLKEENNNMVYNSDTNNKNIADFKNKIE